MRDKIYQLIEAMVNAVIDKLAADAIPAPLPEEKFLTVAEAAEYLEITTRTIGRYKKKKAIVPYDFGGIDSYALSDLKYFRNNRDR